jgi:hypothetical protein
MIYEKTPAGTQAFQQRSAELSAKARSVLIMIDGKRTVAQLLTMLAGIGAGEAECAELLELGFIQEKAGAVDAQAISKPSAVPAPKLEQAQTTPELGSDQERYQAAYPIATRLTSGLGLRGFRLNLSVEGAGNLQDLVQLADKIREAVGEEKYAELKKILGK